MSHRKVIRAWKDTEYRLGLLEAERAQLPANPAGAAELNDAELGAAAGGCTESTCYDTCTVDNTCTIYGFTCLTCLTDCAWC